MKTALSGSVREDGQVKTDDASRGGSLITLAPPLLHMQLQKGCGSPHLVRLTWRVKAAAWGDRQRRLKETCQTRPNRGLPATGRLNTAHRNDLHTRHEFSFFQLLFCAINLSK